LGDHRKTLLAVLGVVLVAGFALAALALFLFAYLADEGMEQDTLRLDTAGLEGLGALPTPLRASLGVPGSFRGSGFLAGQGAVARPGDWPLGADTGTAGGGLVGG